MAAHKNDRRTKRTRRLLHEALRSLMFEKRYEAITVQDIIDRADVARSTFYAHFQDKEDLMASVWTYMIEVISLTPEQSSATGDLRLLPMRELFEHVREHRKLFKGMVRGRGLELFFEHGQAYWSQKIAVDLEARLPAGQQPSVPIPVMAQFLAGTCITMLRWWLDNKMSYSPEEMDQMLQRLVLPGVQNSLGEGKGS